MTKENIDYKAIAEDLIWRNASDKNTKNEGSMYYVVDVDGYEERGISKGSIQFGLCVQSWIHPDDYHELTWKELCLALKSKGYEHLISDGHDCSVCLERKDCHADFKDDLEQERCSRWKEEWNELKKNAKKQIKFTLNFSGKESIFELSEPAKFMNLNPVPYCEGGDLEVTVNKCSEENYAFLKDWHEIFRLICTPGKVMSKDNLCCRYAYTYGTLEKEGIAMLHEINFDVKQKDYDYTYEELVNEVNEGRGKLIIKLGIIY